MTEKKPILLLASATTLALALHYGTLSASPMDESPTPAAAQTAAAEPTTPATENPAPWSASQAEGSTDTQPQVPAGLQIAAPVPPESPAASPPPPAIPPEVPTGAPVTAPTWPTAGGGPGTPTPHPSPMPGARRAQLGDMTPEERSALRQQRFQEMRDRVMKRHQEMTARWDSHWKILDAMTPEQKEAIQAVFGTGKKRCAHYTKSHQMPPRAPMPPRFGQPDYGFPSGAVFPGYGYGPQGSEPHPYQRGPSASWLGDQPLMYPTAPQPWYSPDQRPFQGPPPPNGDYPQP